MDKTYAEDGVILQIERMISQEFRVRESRSSSTVFLAQTKRHVNAWFNLYIRRVETSQRATVHHIETRSESSYEVIICSSGFECITEMKSSYSS